MFCPACGFESNQKTNFCKRCGAGVGTPASTESTRGSRLWLAMMFGAVGLFGLLGLVIVYGVYDSLVMRGVRGPELLAPFVLGLGFIGALVGLLVWQLSRMINAFQRVEQNVVVEKHFIREVPQGQLGTFTDQSLHAVEPGSVIEETTRQFAKH